MRRAVRFVLQLAVALLLVSCEKEGDLELPATRLQVSQPCEVEAGCVASASGFSLRFFVGPGIRVLAPFPVSVEVRGGQGTDSVTATFAMQGMDMGVNRYRLINDGADRWIANVTLPVCTSGRSDWVAALEVKTKERRFAVEIPFVIDN